MTPYGRLGGSPANSAVSGSKKAERVVEHGSSVARQSPARSKIHHAGDVIDAVRRRPALNIWDRLPGVRNITSDAEEHVVNSGRVVFSGIYSEAQQVIMRHR